MRGIGLVDRPSSRKSAQDGLFGPGKYLFLRGRVENKFNSFKYLRTILTTTKPFQENIEKTGRKPAHIHKRYLDVRVIVQCMQNRIGKNVAVFNDVSFCWQFFEDNLHHRDILSELFRDTHCIGNWERKEHPCSRKVKLGGYV